MRPRDAPGAADSGQGTSAARGRVEAELGGLALSAFRGIDPPMVLRAAHLRNVLHRFGTTLPLWTVHDLATPALREVSRGQLGPRPELELQGEAATAQDAWAATVDELAGTETYAQARRWRLQDELLAVLLLRVLGTDLLGTRDGPREAGDATLLPLDPALFQQTPATMFERYRRSDRRRDLEVLGRLVARRLRLLMAVEHVDLETLRLLGLFGPEAATAVSADHLVDLLGVFRNAEASDVASFTLDLLPSVLETRKAHGEQRFSIDGYAGIERRGSLDSLVLTELAYDEELFDRRFVDREAFYYAREKQDDEERRLHYLVVDATAGMRGLRSTFARGLALALAKKLLLQGEEVWYRFFDARLYEVHRAGGRRGPRQGSTSFDAAHLLSFRGERGRNYAKVFGLLANELDRLSGKQVGEPVLYLLSHGECHIPLETVERLRQRARLYGVFMLPSEGTLDLDYTHRFHTVQVVDRDALGRTQERTRRALSIVEDASGQGDAGGHPRGDDRPRGDGAMPGAGW